MEMLLKMYEFSEWFWKKIVWIPAVERLQHIV